MVRDLQFLGSDLKSSQPFACPWSGAETQCWFSPFLTPAACRNSLPPLPDRDSLPVARAAIIRGSDEIKGSLFCDVDIKKRVLSANSPHGEFAGGWNREGPGHFSELDTTGAKRDATKCLCYLDHSPAIKGWHRNERLTTVLSCCRVATVDYEIGRAHV